MPDAFLDLASRFNNRPLLVDLRRGRPVIDALCRRELLVPGLSAPASDPNASELPISGNLFHVSRDNGDQWRPYEVIGGVAIIEVDGLLLHNLGWLCSFWGITGYDGIAAQFEMAAADPEVRVIVLHIDSGGGEVAGCFDLVDRIYTYRATAGSKPVVAILDEVAFSAAYAIASAAETIIVPRTGGVGSIGVVAMHVDMSRWLENEGLAVSLIHAGARKVDTYPYAPLSETARALIQAEVDATASLFHRTVARNRGHAAPDLTAEAVAGLEAGCFMGLTGEASSTGLADLVLAPEEALSRVIADAA